MKKILTLFVSLSISLPLFSQTVSEEKKEKYHKVFTKVEQPAEFPGGEKVYLGFLQRNLKVAPLAAFLKNGPQTAMVKFVVDSTGSVSNVSVMNEEALHPEVAKEALRFIRRGPKWKPALQNGRTVNSQVIQPVTFPAAQ